MAPLSSDAGAAGLTRGMTDATDATDVTGAERRAVVSPAGGAPRCSGVGIVLDEGSDEATGAPCAQPRASSWGGFMRWIALLAHKLGNEWRIVVAEDLTLASERVFEVHADQLEQLPQPLRAVILFLEEKVENESLYCRRRTGKP